MKLKYTNALSEINRSKILWMMSRHTYVSFIGQNNESPTSYYHYYYFSLVKESWSHAIKWRFTQFTSLAHYFVVPAAFCNIPLPSWSHWGQWRPLWWDRSTCWWSPCWWPDAEGRMRRYKAVLEALKMTHPWALSDVFRKSSVILVWLWCEVWRNVLAMGLSMSALPMLEVNGGMNQVGQAHDTKGCACAGKSNHEQEARCKKTGQKGKRTTK